jgi:hypothetical protein
MIKHDVTKTTLGDLITALTEEIAWYVDDEREASILVAYVLSTFFTNHSQTVN